MSPPLEFPTNIFQGTRPNSFDLISPALFETFCQKCRSMYEQGHEGSPKDKLLVYSGLSNISSQVISEETAESAGYYHNLTKGFQYLLLQALASFPMLASASMDTAEAMLCAVSFASTPRNNGKLTCSAQALTTIGMCKPSLSWSLSCAAVRMCQTLGYHRLSRIDPKSDPMFNRKVSDPKLRDLRFLAEKAVPCR